MKIIIPLFLLSFLFCVALTESDLDETSPGFIAPVIKIDTASSSLKPGDTIHFDTASLVLNGNKPESLFQMRLDSGSWSQWEPAGIFLFKALSDGKHTVYINTKYSGGKRVFSDSIPIKFFVKVAGYPAIFPTLKDTIISTDTGNTISIEVKALGVDTINYSWFRAETVEGIAGKKLILQPFLLEDTGSYKCIASNAYGKDTSRIFILKFRPIKGGLKGTLEKKGDSNKLAEAIVTLLSGNYKDTSNSDGQFEFFKLVTGTYSIKINLSGYLEKTITMIEVNDSTVKDMGIISLSPVIIDTVDTHTIDTTDTITVVKTVKIFYDGNGSENGAVPQDTVNYKVGGSVLVLGNTGNLTKPGSIFKGWNTKNNGNGVDFQAGSTFNLGDSNMTLYAKWALIFSVIYNGNTNAGGSVPIDSNKYETGAIVTVLGNSGDLVKDRYSFAGWNTNETGTGIDYNAGATFTMATNSKVLYAKWTTKPTYSITYFSNGSTGGMVPAVVNCDSGSQVIIADKGTLMKTGYSFLGWNSLSDGNGKALSPGLKFKMDSANILLYAQWKANTYILKYNGNGSTGGVPPDSTKHLYGAQGTVAGAGSLLKTGHTFVGWNTDSMGNGIDYTPGAMITIGEANIILYARWSINKYTIIFNSRGGCEVATQTIKYNNTVNVPTAPTKKGYIFDGWFEETNCLNLWMFEKKIIVNDTLYAKWIIKDIEGNIYTEVKIGSQVWMVENLKTVKYNDGSAILSVDSVGQTTSPGYCWYYNKDSAYKKDYGMLYNWYAVVDSKFAPPGWHVPTEVEWDTLQNYLIVNGYNYDGTTIDNKIAKSLASKWKWSTSTTAGAVGNDLTANNRSGFSALPGGYRNKDNHFDGIDGCSNWWCATENGASVAQCCVLISNDCTLGRYQSPKNSGLAVRLIRDY
jgi:uncharacterized protein (TIGR02145 family)/uncharacterized repeat protein (TIGR02543 family)